MSNQKSENNKGKFDLDKLEKTNFYQVPQGYFDELPGVIQSRVTDKKPFFNTDIFRITIKYALPATFLIVIGLYFGFFSSNTTSVNYENMLAEVSSEELLSYLNETDISVEEIIETIGEEEVALGFDIEALELFEELNIDGENLDELLEEFENSSDYF